MGSVLKRIESSLHERMGRSRIAGVLHKSKDADELEGFKSDLRRIHERFMVCSPHGRVDMISFQLM
jgi:hypothetical protein